MISGTDTTPPKQYPQTVPALLRLTVAHASSPAIQSKGKLTSYGELLEKVACVSRTFHLEGVRRGDAVCLWLDNGLDWVVCHLALASLGAITVPISTRFKEMELTNILASSHAIGLVTQSSPGGLQAQHVLAKLFSNLSDSRVSGASDELANLKFVLEGNVSGNPLPNARSIYDDKGAEPLSAEVSQNVNGTDVAFVIYTSGTTGTPKGVVLDQAQVIRKGYGRAEVHEFTGRDRMLMLAPFYTVSGGVMSLYTGLASGSELVLVPKFSGAAALDALTERSCTVIHGVNAVIQKMLESANGRTFLHAGIRNVNVGGAPLSKMMIAEVARVFGGRISVSYGMSEATGAITYSRLSDELSDDYLASGVGRPLPGVDVRIVDAVSKKELPDGECGEIQIRGYLVMKGYFHRNVKSDSAVDSKGWLSSGDLGRIDRSGHLHFVGRLKESYRFNGFNVYPSEVEALLESHDAIQTACVVPIPDERFGEIGVAFLEIREGHKVDTAAVVASLKDKVAGYKLPAQLFCVDEMPRAESYKIDRARLRTEALRRYAKANSNSRLQTE